MEIPPPVNQLQGVLGFAPSDDGRAAKLAFVTPGGPISLQVEMDDLRSIINGLLQAAVACAARRTDLTPIEQSDPAFSVYLPVEEIRVLHMKGAHRRVVMRAGTLDMSLVIRTPREAAVLAKTLRP